MFKTESNKKVVNKNRNTSKMVESHFSNNSFLEVRVMLRGKLGFYVGVKFGEMVFKTTEEKRREKKRKGKKWSGV